MQILKIVISQPKFLRVKLANSSSLKALDCVLRWPSILGSPIHHAAPPVWRLLTVSWAGLQFLGVQFTMQLLQFEGFWMCSEPAFNYWESSWSTPPLYSWMCLEPAFNYWESSWSTPPLYRLLNVSWDGLQLLRVQLVNSSLIQALDCVLSWSSILENPISQLLQFEGSWICPELAFNS